MGRAGQGRDRTKAKKVHHEAMEVKSVPYCRYSLTSDI